MLQDLFRKVDTDSSGQVGFQEFEECMRNPAIFEIMNRRFGMQRHEVQRIFRALDVDSSGEVSVQEWMETLQTLMKTINEGERVTYWELRALKQQLRTQSQKIRTEETLPRCPQVPLLPCTRWPFSDRMPQGAAVSSAVASSSASRGVPPHRAIVRPRQLAS